MSWRILRLANTYLQLPWSLPSDIHIMCSIFRTRLNHFVSESVVSKYRKMIILCKRPRKRDDDFRVFGQGCQSAKVARVRHYNIHRLPVDIQLFRFFDERCKLVVRTSRNCPFQVGCTMLDHVPCRELSGEPWSSLTYNGCTCRSVQDNVILSRHQRNC